MYGPQRGAPTGNTTHYNPYGQPLYPPHIQHTQQQYQNQYPNQYQNQYQAGALSQPYAHTQPIYRTNEPHRGPPGFQSTPWAPPESTVNIPPPTGTTTAPKHIPYSLPIQEQIKRMSTDPELSKITSAVVFSKAASRKDFSPTAVLAYIQKIFNQDKPPPIHIQYTAPAPAIIKDLAAKHDQYSLVTTDTGISIQLLPKFPSTKTLARVVCLVPHGSTFKKFDKLVDGKATFVSCGKTIRGKPAALFKHGTPYLIQFATHFAVDGLPKGQAPIPPSTSQARTEKYKDIIKFPAAATNAYVYLNELAGAFLDNRHCKHPDLIKLLDARKWFKKDGNTITSTPAEIPTTINIDSTTIEAKEEPVPHISMSYMTDDAATIHIATDLTLAINSHVILPATYRPTPAEQDQICAHLSAQPPPTSQTTPPLTTTTATPTPATTQSTPAPNNAPPQYTNNPYLSQPLIIVTDGTKKITSNEFDTRILSYNNLLRYMADSPLAAPIAARLHHNNNNIDISSSPKAFAQAVHRELHHTPVIRQAIIEYHLDNIKRTIPHNQNQLDYTRNRILSQFITLKPPQQSQSIENAINNTANRKPSCWSDVNQTWQTTINIWRNINVTKPTRYNNRPYKNTKPRQQPYNRPQKNQPNQPPYNRRFYQTKK